MNECHVHVNTEETHLPVGGGGCSATAASTTAATAFCDNIQTSPKLVIVEVDTVSIAESRSIAAVGIW